MKQGPTISTKESLTIRIRATQGESGPCMMNHCPAGRIRVPWNESGPDEQIRAPLEPCNTNQRRRRRTSQVLAGRIRTPQDESNLPMTNQDPARQITASQNESGSHRSLTNHGHWTFMMNQGPEAGLFLFFYMYIFIFVRDCGPPQKIVRQIRGVFSFGVIAVVPSHRVWVTSPSWPPQNRRLDPPLYQGPSESIRSPSIRSPPNCQGRSHEVFFGGGGRIHGHPNPPNPKI